MEENKGQISEKQIEPSEDEILVANQSLIEELNLTVTVQLGKVRMSLKDISKLQTDQVIELHKSPSAPVELYVEERLIAKGELVDIEGELGVKLIELFI